MTLLPGARLGPYEVLSPLGAGGMGEVYRARDTRLDRSVAIKVLPAHLSTSPELKARFEREAKAVSSLNHPHICVLHDVGSQDGTDYIVMELLEGETLQDRLKKGALLLEQALQLGIEIADALDKAHRQGIVHRDLKPGNVMLTKSGAKLLDFGLAKANPITGAQATLSALPTQEKGLTERGTVLGTFQYMSPEQLEGKEADARTDIFAFGCVLYEMVTGKRAFEGKSTASLISAILKDEPKPISELRPLTPPSLERLVRTCLAKDPDERWQSAHDVMAELRWIGETGRQALAASGARRSGPGRLAAAGLGFLLGAAIVGSAFLVRRRDAEPVRFLNVVIPADQEWEFNNAPTLVLSPDGTRLAYVASVGGVDQIFIRSLERLDSIPLPGTRGARRLFFSPDGRWLGFRADGKLKKIHLSGGVPLVVCPVGELYGAVWGPDDRIVFSTGAGGLRVVSSAGGSPEALTKPDPQRSEVAHYWPEILPGGKAVLFTIFTGGGHERSRIAALSLETGRWTTLVERGTYPRYLASGHLVFARGDTLLGVPFDASRMAVTGAEFPALDDAILVNLLGVAHVSISNAGWLLYARAGALRQRALVWVDASGASVSAMTERRGFVKPSLSPDGRRLAVVIYDGLRQDLWTAEVGRQPLTRLTFEGLNTGAVWSPDGTRVAFSSEDGLYWKRADGSGRPNRVATHSLAEPTAWSPDGRLVLFGRVDPKAGGDVWAAPVERDGPSQPVLTSSFNELSAVFSPDGRWLAYVSDETGRHEVYVQSFPLSGGKWQISTEGGEEPVWRSTGLYYRNGKKMMAVDISTTSGLRHATPRVAFEGDYLLYENRREVPAFDVTPDGKRFLMIQRARDAAGQFGLVVGWSRHVQERSRASK